MANTPGWLWLQETNGCAVEILNENRTNAYAPLNPYFSGYSQAGCRFPVLDYDPCNLDLITYTTPNDPLNPAPWYTSGDPGSAAFLGFYLETVTGLDGSHWSRGTNQRALSGASLSALRAGGREMAFEVIAIARNREGLEWGRRWLENQLAATCDPCTLYRAYVRLFPVDLEGRDGDEVDFEAVASRGLFYIRGIGMTQGPTWSEPPLVGAEQSIQRLTFTLYATEPCMAQCPTVALTAGTDSNWDPDLIPGPGISLDYEDVILDDDPIAYWPMTEATAVTAIDATGNGFNLPYPPVTSVRSSFVPCLTTESAKRFIVTGTNTYLPTIVQGAYPMIRSVECWMSVDDLAPSGSPLLSSLVVEGYGLNNGISIAVVEDDGIGGTGQRYLDVTCWDGDGSIAAEITIFPIAATTAALHLAATLSGDNQTFRFYINGALVDTQSAAGGNFSTADMPNPGFDLSLNEAANTSLAHVAFYSDELTAGEVSDHYQAGLTCTATGGCIPFNEWLCGPTEDYDPICAAIPASAAGAKTSAQVQLYAPSGSGRMQISLTMNPQNLACNSGALPPPCSSMVITGLPAGATVLVDGGAQQILYRPLPDSDWVPGDFLIVPLDEVTGGFAWPAFSGCVGAWLKVRPYAHCGLQPDIEVTVSYQQYEGC